MAIKKRLCKVIVFFMVIVVLTVASFCVPRYKAKADVFSAVALGTGALGAIVAAYFATAGVSFSSNTSSDGQFLGNYVSNWVKNNPSFVNQPYFDSSGEYIGSEDQLSVVQNNDTGAWSFIFGKDFAMWLEALKQAFVSEKALTSEESTTLYDATGFLTVDGDLLVPGIAYTDSSYPYMTHMIDAPFTSGQSCYYEFENGNFFNISVSDVTDRVYIVASVNGSIRQSSSNLRSNYLFIGMWLNGNSYVVYPFYGNMSVGNYIASFSPSFFGDSSTFDLSGELTAGYSDFEDAINQDLDSENDLLVVGVDVGSYPEVLNPSELADGILDSVAEGTYDGGYTGTYENKEEAEQDKEGTKPFTPQYPNGWVPITGLQNFFPFCIPWDLYYLFSILNAPAEAPYFEWDMSFGPVLNPIFGTHKIVIDLRPYSTVALVFRTMIVFIYLFFLIKRTRSLIRG